MGKLAAWIGSFLGGSFASVFTSVSNSALQWYAKAKDTQLAGFQAGAVADTATFQAMMPVVQAEIAAQTASRSWWGPKLLCMVVGLPACAYQGSIYIVSWINGIFYGGKTVWIVQELPPESKTILITIISYVFAQAILGPPTSAISAWFHKK